MGVGGQRHTPAALPPGKIRYPLYRRLGGPQGRSGRVRKISPPPGFDPRTFHLAASCYTGSATLAPSKSSVLCSLAAVRPVDYIWASWNPYISHTHVSLIYFDMIIPSTFRSCKCLFPSHPTIKILNVFYHMHASSTIHLILFTFNTPIIFYLDWESSVGIETYYVLDCPGINPQLRRDFPNQFRTAQGSTQPPTQWVRGHCRG